jgi:type I restriction enzyme S subunit
MNAAWKTVRLGEVVAQVARAESPIPGTIYRQIGVKLWGEGAYERESIDGSQTKYAQLFRTEAGDIIVNKIWARNGSVAVVSPALAGCFGSGEFPMFTPKTDRLESLWVHWLTKTRNFWEQCDEKSRGTSGQNRIKPEQFLKIEIPLPPLSEQRRIVARIEELAAQIQEAKELRKQAEEKTEALFVNQIGKIFTQLSNTCSPRHFGSFSPHVTSGPRNWAKHYEQTGLRFYRAQDIGSNGHILNDSKVFITPPPGDQGRTAKLHDGDLMIVITGATVGRVSVYRQGLEPGFVSQHVAICRLPQDEIISEFALWGLRGPMGQTQLLGQRYGQGKPGLNLTNIRALSLPVPPLLEQRRIVAELDALQAEVDALKRLQTETTAELDALLPAVLDRAFKGEL